MMAPIVCARPAISIQAQESIVRGADRCQESGMHLAQSARPQVSSSKHKAPPEPPVARNPWAGKIKNLGWAQVGVGNFAYHHELL